MDSKLSDVDRVSAALLISSASISIVSIGLLVDATEKNKRTEQNLKNLTRLQLITAITSEENIKEDSKMSIKLTSKISNGTKIMAAGGVVLMGGAAAKHFLIDAKEVLPEGTEPGKTILGMKPTTFAMGAAGAGLFGGAVAKGTVEVIKANKALKAPAEELPEAADPTADDED